MEDDKRPQHKVVIIRLPANYQNNLPTGVDGSNIPTITNLNQLNLSDEVIAQMMSGQYQATHNNTTASASSSASTNMNIDVNTTNVDQKTLNINMVHDHLSDVGGQLAAMHSTDHPSIHQQTTDCQTVNNNTTTNNNNSNAGRAKGDHATHTTNDQSISGNSLNNVKNNANTNNQDANQLASVPPFTQSGDKSDDANTTHESGAELQETMKEDDTIQYKNYTPKQREWMLVVLSFARGLLNKPFEMKLQDMVIEKARELLKKNAASCRMDRIPTPKTLRSVWKNLWKHPDRTVSSVKKGGRPRIDPALKRQKRNERERRRRAALRLSKVAGENQDGEQHSGPTTRRSRRGSRAT